MDQYWKKKEDLCNVYTVVVAVLHVGGLGHDVRNGDGLDDATFPNSTQI